MTRIILQLELAYRYSRWMEIYPVSSTDRVSLIRKFLYLPRKRLVIWFLLLRCDEKTIVNRNVNLSTRRIFIRRAFQAHYFTSASWRSTLTEPFHDTSIIPYIVHLRIPMNFDILLLVSRDTRSNWSSERTDCADKSRSTRSMMPRRRNPFDLSLLRGYPPSDRMEFRWKPRYQVAITFFTVQPVARLFLFSLFFFFFSFFSFFTNGRESSIEDERRRKKVGPVFSSGLRPFRVFILIGRLSVHGFSPAHLISGAARVEARSRRKRCRAASYGWSSPTTTSCDDRWPYKGRKAWKRIEKETYAADCILGLATWHDHFFKSSLITP